MKEQLLFDIPKVQIDKPIRLIELFGGIGSQAMALRDIGANFEHYRLVEFDKYCVNSYNSIHHTNFKPMDIKSVHGVDLGIERRNEFTYLLTYSFPCTDLSVAGKMLGMSRKEWKEGKSTRSGLLWEVERILEECNELPQILLMENVPQVHAEKNMTDFEAWLAFLRSRGYFNYYKDLNAKDYGIAQNRNRCFCVSILSSVFIDYEFPESVKLEKVMSDYLEDQVDEKYYIKNDKAAKLIIDLLERGVIGKDQKQITVDLCKKANEIKIANCITANENRGISNIPKQGTGILEIGYLKDKAEKIHQSNKVYGSRGIAPTINANAGTHHNIIKTIVAMRGRNLNNSTARVAGAPTEQRLEPAPQNLVNTLTTVQKDNLCLEIKQATNYRIRKLTPRECWRLMGYTDADFEKSASVESNTQLYKQAGNAIVKQVLMAIFSQMNIKGVKTWNDMTSEEKYNLIRKSTTEKKSKKNNLTH